MRIAFDMSSVLWTCLSAGTDSEGSKVHHNGRLMQVNTAAYGYENAVNHVVSTLRNCNLQPKDMIMVFEGIDSKAPRLAITNTYKAKRGNKPTEAYLEFETLKNRLQELFGSFGACSLTQDNAEGDDTLGYLAYNMEEDLFISTNDGDLTVLNGTNQYGAEITVLVNGIKGENKYGDWPTRFVTVYKAMVGDVSDSITGIRGFGIGAFNDFYKEFGVSGMAELDRMARLNSLDELIDELSNKMIARIYDGREDFLTSYKLAKIYPEWVNTFNNPLKFQPGLIRGVSKDERVSHWNFQTQLITADKWEDFKGWAKQLIGVSDYVGLDIETSTPDESDEWLAAQGDEEAKGVDVIGSVLTGMSLTFGRNLQQTVYIPSDHAATANVAVEAVRDFIKELCDVRTTFIIHNFSFEGTVLHNTWGKEWLTEFTGGLLPNVLDTILEASYVDENSSRGLKALSERHFGYKQVDYLTVTTIDGVQYKMRELTGAHVKDYGCDDTVCTVSFHNFAKLFMQLEHTWNVYLDVEIDAMYGHVQSFIHGTKCDVAKSKELEAIDDQTYNGAATIFDTWLVSQGWEGTVAPTYSASSTPAELKAAFEIVYKKPLETAVRKIDRLADAMLIQGGPIMGDFIIDGDWEGLTNYVRSYWTAKPIFNPGSPKQMQDLMYTKMGLPIRVYNKATPIMRKAGLTKGSPKTDALAFTYALNLDCTPEQKPVLEALKLMKMVETRRGLYYKPWPYFVHWKTGRIHSSHNQSATNTRRASSSKPNLQQLAKAMKIEGQAARYREVMIPHHKNAVVVSMDFVSQEVLLLAEWSHDPVLEEVFTGDPPKDMHSMTGVGIYNDQMPSEVSMSYETFKAVIDDQHHSQHKTCKKYRALGKAINFSGQYRVGAPKMATMLFVTEVEAQAMIDAKAEAFPVSEAWAVREMEQVKLTGVVRSMLGAVRHLGPALRSKDKYESSKADRQALSYRIQGSAAEMTKQAEGAMWRAKLEQTYDCQIIAPVHDEVVASCAIADLFEFIPAMHACMTRHYANMRLPIRSSISFGRNFGEQIEVGNEPTSEAIQKGLDELLKME